MLSIGLRGPQWSCDPTTNGFEGSGQESDYITNQSGQVVTKTTMDEGVMTWDYTNVYADGQLFATYDAQGLHFQLNDWLGTRRVTTDYAGVVEETCASLPYGSGLNCSGSEYAPNEQHFTGKTHDAESGLDYFGARYYSENDARFMSPDWSAKVEPVPYAKLDNPQSLNLYSYVLDNPLSGVDSNGHKVQGKKHHKKAQQQNNTSNSTNTNTNTNTAPLVAGVAGRLTPGANGAAQAAKQLAKGKPRPSPDAPLRDDPGTDPPPVKIPEPGELPEDIPPGQTWKVFIYGIIKAFSNLTGQGGSVIPPIDGPLLKTLTDPNSGLGRCATHNCIA